MIITRTPFRISFSGGGSDLPSFYEKHTGCVLSTTINKYMHIAIHPYFYENKIVLKYSQTEIVDYIDEIEHRIFKQVLKDFNLTGIEITSIADIPAGTGLGSSSAFTVGLLHAIYSYLGKYVSKDRLAEEACEVEINKLREPIGKQDQYASAYGGINFITFDRSGKVFVEPIIMKTESYRKLEENLLLFYTGSIRSASKILQEQAENMKNNNKFKNTIKLTELTQELKNALQNNEISKMGEILHESWNIKKSLASGITNDYINQLYEKAINNGATGGKLLGAGGSGFLLFYCEKENHEKLRNSLRELRELDFKFDYEGSKVIYVGDKR